MIVLFDVMLSYLLNPYWKPLCTECVDLFCDNFGHLFSMYWERLHTFIQWQLARCSFLWWHTGHTSLHIIIATWPKGNIWQRTSKVAYFASTFTINILSCVPVSRAVHVSCCVFVMCILRSRMKPLQKYSPNHFWSPEWNHCKNTLQTFFVRFWHELVKDFLQLEVWRVFLH